MRFADNADFEILIHNPTMFKNYNLAHKNMVFYIKIINACTFLVYKSVASNYIIQYNPLDRGKFKGLKLGSYKRCDGKVALLLYLAGISQAWFGNRAVFIF